MRKLVCLQFTLLALFIPKNSKIQPSHCIALFYMLFFSLLSPGCLQYREVIILTPPQLSILISIIHVLAARYSCNHLLSHNTLRHVPIRLICAQWWVFDIKIKFIIRYKSQYLFCTINTLMTDSSIISHQSLISEPEKQTDLKDKTFVQRAFSPMQAGAMRGSIFALLASAMGTGMFNLPYRINQIGVLPYLLFILVSGLFSYVGMYLLSRLINKFSVESYSDMCQKSYGKVFRKVAEFCLVLYPWGITVCFQVIFAKFVVQLLADLFGVAVYEPDGGRETETYTNLGQLIRMCVTGGAIIVNLFFILKKEIGLLQKISIIGVLSAVINVVIITVTMFIGFQVKNCEGVNCEYHGITQLDWGKINLWGIGGWDMFSKQMQGLASIIFCYVNHQLVFPLVNDLKNPTKRRMDKVFFRVHLTEVIVYMAVGMTGYLLLVEHVPDREINAVVMASIVTKTMSLGKCLMVVALFFAVPLNLFPARQVLYETFEMQKNNKNHIILSLSLAFSGALIAIVFQKVNSYFGLLGGTAGVMMAGGIPAICYYKLKGLRTRNQKMLVLFMGIVSIFAMFGAFLSVLTPA